MSGEHGEDDKDGKKDQSLKMEHNNNISISDPNDNGRVPYEALIESEEKYRTMFDNAPDSVFYVDDKGVVIECSISTESLYGYPRDEIIGKHLSSFMTPASVEVFRENFPKLKRLEQVDGTIQIINGSGETIDIWRKGIPLTNAEGKFIGVLAFDRDITKQTKAELALAKSEMRFKGFFEKAGDAIYVHVLKDEGFSNFIEVNDIACKLLGYTQEELLKLSPKDISAPANAQEQGRQEVRKKLQEGQWRIFEAVHITKDGKKIPVEISSRAFDLGGQTMVMSLARDITERKLTQAALRESEERYKSIFEGASDAIITTDPFGNITSWNKKAQEMLCYDTEEFMGRPIATLAPENLRDKEREVMMKVRETGIIQNHESIAVDCNGKHIPIEYSITAMKDPDGELLGFSGIIRNITERKLAEAALQESEERFREMADMLPEAIFEADLNLDLKYANHHAFEIFGYHKGDLLNLNCIDLVDPKEIDRVRENLAGRMRGEDKGLVEYLALRKDGSTFPMLLHLTHIIRKGKTDGFRGIVIDITERKQAEEALKESEEKYRIIYETSGDAVMTLEPPEWKFTSGNNKIMEMFGVKDVEEFISLAPWQISPEYQPDGQSSLVKSKEMIGIAMEEGENFFEWTHKKMRGEDFYATILLSRVEIGGKAFLQARVKDITERKQVEDALKESEERYRELFENAPDAIFLAEVETGIIIDANSAALKLMKMPWDDVVGLHQSKLHPDWIKGKEDFKQHMNEAKEKGTASPTESYIVRPDGREIPVDITARVIQINGKPVSQGVFRDISERKEMEKKTRMKTAELEKFGSLSVDREMKMVELKTEINALLERLGEEKRYKTLPVIDHKGD